MKERPGKEVGCSDRQFIGEGVPLFLLQMERSYTCRCPSYSISSETIEGILVAAFLESDKF